MVNTEVEIIPLEAGRKVVDLNQLIYWVTMQATKEEIAASFGICVRTLKKIIRNEFGMLFSELREMYSGTGKLALRRYQFRLAEKNATMAIWLGKQWLGQRDIEAEHDKAKQAFEAFNNHVSALLRRKKEEEGEEEYDEGVPDYGSDKYKFKLRHAEDEEEDNRD